jgi:hypothetical protein
MQLVLLPSVLHLKYEHTLQAADGDHSQSQQAGQRPEVQKRLKHEFAIV